MPILASYRLYLFKMGPSSSSIIVDMDKVTVDLVVVLEDGIIKAHDVVGETPIIAAKMPTCEG